MSLLLLWKGCSMAAAAAAIHGGYVASSIRHCHPVAASIQAAAATQDLLLRGCPCCHLTTAIHADWANRCPY
jgi:hypothetical protein